ncbi:MAG: hypothetical protein U0133_04015 [Gemmatimonadales bacterium]
MLAPLLLALQATMAPMPGMDMPAATEVQVAVDSGRHTVVITAGPFDLPDMSAHAEEDHSMSHDTPVQKFAWPVEGWFRGFKIEVLGGDGAQLPPKLMHHMIMINYDRRQLIYPAAERLWGAGAETGAAQLPRTIGVPLAPGSNLGLYIAWHNTLGRNLSGVKLRMTMEWMPRNQNPRPVDVLPLYMDVNLTVGGANEFDVPPGRSEKAYTFSVPVEGRLLGVSGHMHQYGKEVRLEEVGSGKVLARVKSVQRADGSVRKMERHLFGVSGEGLKLSTGKQYRVVAVYDNPTGETLVKGAMGSMVGIYAPAEMGRWPKVEPSDTTFQRDLRFLARRGFTGMKSRSAPASADSASHGEHQHAH